MADIDKALTEIRKKVEIAGPEEQVEVQEENTESYYQTLVTQKLLPLKMAV